MFLFRKDLNNLPCISSRVAEMISRMSPIVSLSFLQHRRCLTSSRRRSRTCNLQILGRNRAGMTERWSTSKDSCFQAILFISALFSSCPSVTESSRLSRLWLKSQMSLRWVTEGLEVFCGGVSNIFSLKLNLWRLDGWSHKHLPSRSRRKKTWSKRIQDERIHSWFMNVNLNHIRNSILEVEFTLWYLKEIWHIQNIEQFLATQVLWQNYSFCLIMTFFVYQCYIVDILL